jgi:ribosomal protein L23
MLAYFSGSNLSKENLFVAKFITRPNFGKYDIKTYMRSIYKMQVVKVNTVNYGIFD